MSEMEKLADAIDPRKHPVPTIEPPAWNWRPRHDDLIAASNTLRQHATALEIGRGREADIDALCRAMWPVNQGNAQWAVYPESGRLVHPDRDDERNGDRTRMHAFLANPAARAVLASLGVGE